MLHALSQPVHSQNSSSIYSHKLRLRPHRCQYPTLASTPTSNQDPVHGRVLSVASCTRNFCSHLERTTSRNGVWETSRRSVLSNDCPLRRTAMAAMGLEGRVQRGNGEAITEIRATVNRTERGQRLRALNWVKQVRNELTSAEFALNLDAPAGPINGAPALAASEAEGVGAAANEDRSEGDDGGGKYAGTGSAIDFDGIAEGLESRLRTLQAGRPSSFLESIPEVEVKELTERLKTNLAAVKRASHQGGRGAVGGGGGSASGSAAGGGVVSGVAGNINVNLKDVKVPEFDLFVREDGTVDWDGAIQSGREVARFGQELWDRINGQNPHDEGGARGAGHGAGDKAPRELPEDSPVMVSLNAFGSVLEERELQLQKELDALKAESRAREVSWKTGSERREAQRAIRDKETEVARARRELQLHRIDVDMERICYLIEQDIRESTGTGGASAENRLLVAEFGLLDSQLVNLKRLASDMEGSGNGDASDDAGEGVPVAGLVSVTLVDEDELELISREVQDLKNRLGMDLENLALNMDPEKVARYVRETYDKIRSGIDFYWTGTKILGNDVGYALSLVSKAAQGSILKPREVRTLRRTGKDCLTFIPFLIILILPLTPVGHVVVFSLIQRLFPDFFPSSYTDRRQNLLKMYTEVEKKVDWDDSYPSPGGDDMLEKLRRNFSSTLNPLGDQEERNKEKDR